MQLQITINNQHTGIFLMAQVQENAEMLLTMENKEIDHH